MAKKAGASDGVASVPLLQFWQHEATALEVRAGVEAKKAMSCLTLGIAFVGGGLAISTSSGRDDHFFGFSPLTLAGAVIFGVLAVIGLLFWMEWMALLAKSFQANVHVAKLLPQPHSEYYKTIHSHSFLTKRWQNSTYSVIALSFAVFGLVFWFALGRAMPGVPFSWLIAAVIAVIATVGVLLFALGGLKSARDAKRELVELREKLGIDG